MNILMLHNRYRTAGGEDVVVEAEAALLRARGHQVTLVEADNHAIAGFAGTARAALGAAYNPWRRRWAAEQVRRTGAELVHVHNYFPLLSPAVLDGAADAGAAVVHTLHNYRAICANAQMLRQGEICEQCVGGSPWPALRHRCYRGSAIGTAAIVGMQMAARRLNVWDRPGRRLVALSSFARDKLAAGGLPRDRIVVKPNSIDCVEASIEADERQGIVFVGRLCREKGVETLLDAARLAPELNFTLIGANDGFGAHDRAPANVRFAGALSRAQARAAIARARVLAIPSLWYEGFPMTLLEAYAAATPVVASRLGALAEWIEDGVTGCLVDPGDSVMLAMQLRKLHDDPARARAMGLVGRGRAETRFSPHANGMALEAIYRSAIAELSHA